MARLPCTMPATSKILDWKCSGIVCDPNKTKEECITKHWIPLMSTRKVKIDVWCYLETID